MIFSSTWPSNSSEEDTASAVQLCEEGLFSSCLPRQGDATGTHKFNEPLPTGELVELAHKNFSPETMKKIRWVCKNV